MPAKSKQQQEFFGLALSVKRGETPRSEVSDDVLKVVDNMSEKEIEDYAGTKHKGLPNKKESIDEVSYAPLPADLMARLRDTRTNLAKRGGKREPSLSPSKRLSIRSRIIDKERELLDLKKEWDDLFFELEQRVPEEGDSAANKLAGPMMRVEKKVKKLENDIKSLQARLEEGINSTSSKKEGIVKLKNLLSEVDTNYANEFQRFAAKKLKKNKSLVPRNWKFEEDTHSGSFVFVSAKNPDLMAFVTPFWEGIDAVPVDVYSDSGLEFQKKFPLKSSGDMERDFKAYVKILTDKLNHFDKYIK